MPSKNMNITLKDEDGKAWKCKWLCEARSRQNIFVSGGWAPFVRAHNLKVEDVCIFELIDVRVFEFKVHIFKR